MKKNENDDIRCLCPRCLASYKANTEYRIRRANPQQLVQEVCTYCGQRLGYDYVITTKRRGS